MKKIYIGYQGISGAYSEIAAQNFASNLTQPFETIGLATFDAVFDSLAADKVQYIAVPVENSLAGSVYPVYDLLTEKDLEIVGEVYVRVNHQLLGNKKIPLEKIVEISSHWQALAQCAHNTEKFLPQVKVVECTDTALSAKLLSESSDTNKACIASSIAGEKYGLTVLKKNFEDDKNNYTRFFIIHKKTKQKNIINLKNNKTSLVFTGKDVPSFLFKALACFSLRSINITKIESRPIPKSAWQYYFYIDIDGGTHEDMVKNAIENLHEITDSCTILGSYPKGR